MLMVVYMVTGNNRNCVYLEINDYRLNNPKLYHISYSVYIRSLAIRFGQTYFLIDF